jgi:hypothetical protein
MMDAGILSALRDAAEISREEVAEQGGTNVANVLATQDRASTLQ